MIIRVLAIVFIALGGPPAFAEVVTLKTRGEVTQSFALFAPEKPVAAAILFPGGAGITPLERLVPGQFINRGNFLVRIRYDLVKLGLMVAIIDAPSDQQPGGMITFRGSAEHSQDIGVVVDYLKAKAAVPVWLVGTSRGTESAASVAAKLGPRIDGVVLTSAISARHPKGQFFSVFEFPLDTVRVPALVVAHKDDQCWATPASQAEAIARAFGASPRKKVLIFEGGNPPKSEPCEALAAHGFLGIEKSVAAAIAGFIKGE